MSFRGTWICGKGYALATEHPTLKVVANERRALLWFLNHQLQIIENTTDEVNHYLPI